jgi:hypothetical protein
LLGAFSFSPIYWASKVITFFSMFEAPKRHKGEKAAYAQNIQSHCYVRP